MTKYKLTNKKDVLGQYISPARDKTTPIYNWFSFKHSYSKELVHQLITEFKLNKGSWVLDPFCGGGTTLLSCKELGINSIGYDILPFSVFLTNVKTKTYDGTKLKNILKKFENITFSNHASDSLPDIQIINKAFNKKVKNILLDFKKEVRLIRDKDHRDFFMLGLLSILEPLSYTQKAGGFLRIVKKRVSSAKVPKIFLEKIDKMIEDINLFNANLKVNHTTTTASICDSRKLTTKKKFDAVITSPPYPNRHDYTRIYGLEMIFNFVNNNDELKKIRYDTLRSHVEAKKKFNSNGYKKPISIERLVAKIKKAGLNNMQVPVMLEGYFEDMYLTLFQIKKCLKPKGKVGLVVSNVRFSGINIPVDQILAEIGEQVGLQFNSIYTARLRGNSSQQMHQYKKRASRESIVIWENP